MNRKLHQITEPCPEHESDAVYNAIFGQWPPECVDPAQQKRAMSWASEHHPGSIAGFRKDLDIRARLLALVLSLRGQKRISNADLPVLLNRLKVETQHETVLLDLLALRDHNTPLGQRLNTQTLPPVIAVNDRNFLGGLPTLWRAKPQTSDNGVPA